MSKLTAKLSDGTEWEVVSTAGPTCGMRSGIPYRDETIRVELKPIKPSPPREVWVAHHKQNGTLGGARIANLDNINPAFENFRYVLAEEPESDKDPAGVHRAVCTSCGREFRYLGVTPAYVRYECGGCLGGKPREWVLTMDYDQKCVIAVDRKEAGKIYNRTRCVHVREVLP